jgi:hypothetical protein
VDVSKQIQTAHHRVSIAMLVVRILRIGGADNAAFA